MPEAARLGDMHSCKATNPNGSPHGGGPIIPPGETKVLIGGQPAATIGCTCQCAGPPDKIIKGSISVKINGKGAARKGDSTLHGGTIEVGFLKVKIGD